MGFGDYYEDFNEAKSTSLILSEKMLNSILDQARGNNWLSIVHQFPSNLIESYLIGFEDSFGSYD